MTENVPEIEHSNVAEFKKAYNEILIEVIECRKQSGLTQESLANWIGVSRKKIVELESGKIQVGLLLRCADKFDIRVMVSKY